MGASDDDQLRALAREIGLRDDDPAVLHDLRKVKADATKRSSHPEPFRRTGAMRTGVSTWAGFWALACAAVAVLVALSGGMDASWATGLAISALVGALILRLLQSQVQSRACPRCGERVPNGILKCDRCGFDF
jgi:hypothetical protein